MSALRQIKPMEFSGVSLAVVNGPAPKLSMVAPTELLVDESYQRELSGQSVRLIRKIVQNFSWLEYKPPIVVKERDGYHVIDGQHTAISCATLGLSNIPVVVVAAATVAQRAQAFVGHNLNRIRVGRLAIHKAAVAAGTEEAIDVENVCRRAGVRIRDLSGKTRSYARAGDTSAVSTIYRIIDKYGVIKSRRALEVLVKAGIAPIGECEMLAVAYLVACFGENVVPDLTMAVRVEGQKAIVSAIVKSKETKRWAWECLADIYKKRLGLKNDKLAAA